MKSIERRNIRMTTIQTPQKNRSNALGITAAVFVLAYLLLILYSYYDNNLSGLLFRMVFYPFSMGLAGAVLTRPGMMRRREMQFMVGYIGWIVLETLLVYRSTMYAYQDTLYFAVAFGLVCYPMAFLLEGKTRTQMFRMIFHVLIPLVTIFCLYGIASVLLQTSFEAPNGYLTGISAKEGRLEILAVHPNYYGPALTILFMMSLYMIVSYRHPLIKIAYALTLPIFYVTMALGDTRTNMLATAFGLGLFAMILVLARVKISQKVVRAVVAVLCAAVVMVVAYLGYAPALRGVEALSVKQAAAEAAQTEDNAVMTESRDLLKDLATATGRTRIWKEAMQSVLAKPSILLTGTTNHHTYETIPNLQQFDGRLHNSFLQVLVALGLPGLILLLGFLVIVVIECVRVFFLREDLPLGERFLPAILAACMVIAMSESLFFLESKGVYSPLFFLIAGYIVAVSRDAAMTN